MSSQVEGVGASWVGTEAAGLFWGWCTVSPLFQKAVIASDNTVRDQSNIEMPG